ncbi:MAG: hypothetical protein K0S23_2055 [Fluviicola sp.]|jgi:hypothetical protein|uniref:T9SS type A sorting domain-containing protein n=1 Tax=Fluviicola sp. TaxID=1917219 RepID=UPI00260CF02C|nr:T9SS type A sorting domain-containing protein [Fluviicola sp.]MDF3027748.1 hypothetical protein [Fluviicola sp.]
MKQFYLIATLFCSLIANVGFSQETGQKKPFSSTQHLSPGHSTNKSTSCGVDTIVYPYLKELTFASPSDSFFVDAMVGNVRTAAQAYHIDDQIQIHGVQFWGGAYSTSSAPQTLQVRAYLYSVDASNMPLVKLDSADVNITNTYDYYEAIFATPYVYGQNFAVAVRSVPNDTLAVITNNAGNTWTATNYGESLSWRRFGSGAWNATLAFFGQDLEYMIFPIVSYDITADFTSDDPSCTNTVSEFYSTSSSNLGNRMLNLNAFDAYWNIATADSTFTWTNNSMEQIGEEATYTFTSPGVETISLTAEVQGYYTSCSDTYSDSIIVTEVPVAQTNPSTPIVICDGEIAEISALPSTGVSYQWLMDSVAEVDSTNANYSTGIAGGYAVITSNICGTDTSDVVNVVVNPLPPTPIITESGVFLIASPAGGVYQWYLDGAEILGETNDSLTVLQNGTYTVVVTNAFDCSSESANFEVDYVSLAENSLDLISVFPNPSSGQFTIKAKTSGLISITTSEGKLIHSEQLSENSDMSINLSEYGSAVYFIRYYGEEGETRLRLVVSK